VILLSTIWINYFAICEWRWGQTVGKNALGLVVAGADGERPTWNAALTRSTFRLIDFPLALIGVDWLLVSRSPRHQRLGDRAAGTVVLRKEPPAPEPSGGPEERPPGPTSGELFADASEALGKAGGPPVRAPEPAQPEDRRGSDDPEPTASREFPPATWGARRAIGGTAIGLLIAVLLVPLAALPIDPDLSAFGGDGRVSVGLDGKAQRLVGIGSDGSGTVLGAETADGRLELVGLSDVGGPDRDLGSDGVKIGDRPLGFTARALAVDSDGRILVAGDSQGAAVVERYESDGELDPSFARHGRLDVADHGGRVAAVAGLGGDRVSLLLARGNETRLAAVEIGPGGPGRAPIRSPRPSRSVLAAASAGDGSIAAVYAAPLAVAKYLPAGTPEPGFGTAGIAPLQLAGTRISSTALRPGSDGGEVFVAGASGSSTVIAEIDGAGAPDSGFGADGVARERIFSPPAPPALAPTEHDKVFVAQLDPSADGGSGQVSVARLEEDGGLDGGVIAILLAQGLLALTLVATAANIALAGPAIVAGGRLRVAAARLGIRRPRPKWGRMTVLALLSYYAVAIAYALLVVQPEQEDIARSLGLGSGILTTLLAVFLIAVAAPVSEELFFRGMLFGGLRRSMGRIPAAAVSALVFGALHATTGVTAVPPLIVFGFVLALLYERTGSLLPGMLGHAINNGLALALAV
jgi:CAAX protease family protein